MERAFRLQGLLNLRHLQEDQAAGRLATANAELHQADEAIEAARDRLAAMNPSGAVNLAVAAAMRNAARMQIGESLARREYAQTVVERRQDEFSEARRQSATLEKLENHHIEAFTAEELHKEQVVLDEIASQRGNSNATEGKKNKDHDRSITDREGF